MASEIETIVKGLQTTVGAAGNVSLAYATVDEWGRASRTAELLELAVAIEAACDVAGAERFAYEAVADHIEEVIALGNGRDRIEAVFALLGKPRVRSVQQPRSLDQRTRAFASRLGYGQSKDVLLEALERLRGSVEHIEVLACWMHETVLRGNSLASEAAALRFQADLAERRHPLGALPLQLLAAEEEAPTYMPMYGATAVSKAVQRLENGPSSAPVTLPPPHDQERPAVRVVADDALVARMLECVGPWTSGSNGQAEAKVFAVSPPIGPSGPGKWLLRALPLSCLERVRPLRAERVGVAAVWGTLFAAAANGGAYTSGFGGAYGRLAAWTSLAALVDAPFDATPASADARADACSFMMFGGPGGFWNDVAWDLGVLAVREGGASVAALAATDID